MSLPRDRSLRSPSKGVDEQVFKALEVKSQKAQVSLLNIPRSHLGRRRCHHPRRDPPPRGHQPVVVQRAPKPVPASLARPLVHLGLSTRVMLDLGRDGGVTDAVRGATLLQVFGDALPAGERRVRCDTGMQGGEHVSAQDLLLGLRMKRGEDGVGIALLRELGDVQIVQAKNSRNLCIE